MTTTSHGESMAQRYVLDGTTWQHNTRMEQHNSTKKRTINMMAALTNACWCANDLDLDRSKSRSKKTLPLSSLQLSRGIWHCLHMFEGVLSVLDAGSGVYATLVPPSTYSVISVTTCARILRRTIFLALISIVYSYGIIWLHITAGTFTTQWQTVPVPAIFLLSHGRHII